MFLIYEKKIYKKKIDEIIPKIFVYKKKNFNKISLILKFQYSFLLKNIFYLFKSFFRKPKIVFYSKTSDKN